MMIIWIDGPYHVGKTEVVGKLEKLIDKAEFSIISSDEYYSEWTSSMFENVKNTGSKDLEIATLMIVCSGTLPQNNRFFHDYIKKAIESKIKKYKNIIIEMNALSDEVKKNLIDPLSEKYELLHIIIDATDDVIIERGKKQKDRQIRMTKEDLLIIRNFQKRNYRDAIYIDTTDTKAELVAQKIVKLMSKI